MTAVSSPPEALDGRERKKRATRRALRTAALDLALERGLAAVHINEIAARAGVSTRTFFNYFDTKEDAALVDLPGVDEQALRQLAQSSSDEGLWTELGRLFADAADRTAHEVTELPRLLQLHDRNPSLVSRQLGHLRQFEEMLADAVLARLDDGPSARMRAELIAGAAMTAGRIGIHRWGLDEGKRPAREYVQEAFELLATTLANDPRATESRST
jgi:AcrR family transcriptional regulator